MLRAGTLHIFQKTKIDVRDVCHISPARNPKNKGQLATPNTKERSLLFRAYAASAYQGVQREHDSPRNVLQTNGGCKSVGRPEAAAIIQSLHTRAGRRRVFRVVSIWYSRGAHKDHTSIIKAYHGHLRRKARTRTVWASWSSTLDLAANMCDVFSHTLRLRSILDDCEGRIFSQ
jgi:hypothetical protein